MNRFLEHILEDDGNEYTNLDMDCFVSFDDTLATKAGIFGFQGTVMPK